MKARVLYFALFAAFLMLVGGCSGSDGGSSTGTLSMSVTDAKPVIPGDPTEVWITIEEVRAHKSGGDWVTLPLANKPLRINLLAFQDEKTTDLVTPVQITSGTYTQLRFEISSAYMVINDSDVPIELDVPSGFLRTDKNFTFEVPDGGAVDLTVDFDLSQSIVVTGDGQYKLKPVLHLVDTQEAATIQGEIPEAVFVPSKPAVVTVIWDKKLADEEGTDDDEVYTQVIVTKASDPGPTPFQIFWVVPGEDYIVQVDTDGDGLAELEGNVTSDELETEGFKVNLVEVPT